MYYTLKCDPKTAQDQYDCGEWDYLNYAFVYVPTGKQDSTPNTYPHYKIGSLSPDTIYYTTNPTSTTYQKYLYNTVLESTTTETEFKINSGTGKNVLDKTLHHFQFIIEKSKMLQMGMKSGDIAKMKFETGTSGEFDYKNLTIKMRNTSQTSLTDFISDNLNTVYNYNPTNGKKGFNEIFFDTPHKWQKLLNLLVDVSYEKTAAPKTPDELIGKDTTNGIQSSGKEYYLKFDGTNDYIYSDNIKELNAVTKFTYETWFRVDKWKSWAKLMGKGSSFHIELGGNSGEVYLINRNPDNTYGMIAGVIPLETWVHIAMVYDGTKAENQDKLKLYINGDPLTLSYNGVIPSQTVSNDMPFTLTELYHATATLNGAMRDSRVWLSALDGAVIAEWKNKTVDSKHPNYSDLLVYYPMTEGSGLTLKDHSGKNNDGKFIGTPEWKSLASDELITNPQPFNFIPNVSLFNGDYKSHKDSVMISETIENPQVSIQKYEIVNFNPRIAEIKYGWESGWNYTYSPAGLKVDSVFAPFTTTIINDTLKYHGKPFDVVKAYEIGRYITPYGKGGLDLGPKGFTWIYDVTDYVSLLKGKVDLEAGGQSELIDLKFLFIKGTPPRNLLTFDNLWGDGAMSKSYASLSDNSQISEITVPLLSETKQVMIKTRLTGHGHNSNDGKYPHCCEWKDNTHSIFANKQKVADWHVWQELDCASNPVYPQGGTWPGSREGWCPGDLVKDHDFELTKYLSGNTLSLDYDITKVPANNLGMGGGNYVVAFQLFQYSAANYQNDVEIMDIVAPNDFLYYSRRNPVCTDPTIIVRNNGSAPVTSLKIEYGVSGGTQASYTWTGSIEPNVKQEITLPTPATTFWFGDTKRIFTAKVSLPNNKPDEYAVNDTYSTHFNLPDFYKDKIVLRYTTNVRPQYYSYAVYDLQNKVVFERTNTTPQTTYSDTLNLPAGCYTFRLLDQGLMGLSYWAYPEQGNGSFGIYSPEGNPLKGFNPDFGYMINYSFFLGDVNFMQDRSLDYLINVYPIPAKDELRLNSSYNFDNSEVTIIDESGREYLRFTGNIGENATQKFDIQGLPSGTYFLNLKSKEMSLVRKFIKAE